MEPSPKGSMKSIALEIQRLIDEEENGVLCLVIRSIGSAPGGVGAKMIVLPDGSIRGTVGGGVVEARVIADALNALEDGRGPRNAHYKLDELGMTCGGEMSVYLEPLEAPKRVVIYGGGHVGAAVARVIKTLGCVVTVIDEREEWANRERFPDVDEIVNRPFAEHLTVSPPCKKDHVLIITRGHEQDQLVLEGTIDKQPAYLGMIGSRKKAGQALEQLRAKKVPEERLRLVRSPVGLDIGAVTPEEIAISIAAELVLLWRRGAVPGTPVAKSQNAAKSSGLKPLGKTKDPTLDDVVFDDSGDEEDEDK